MKSIFYCLILLVALSACKEENLRFSNAEVDANNPLVGKWQLVKASFSIGTAEQNWQDIDNGYIINLKKDGSFESNKHEVSQGGKYQIEGVNLILSYSGKTDPSEYTERFLLTGDTLFLSPVSPIVCFEGCTYKFVRIR